MIKTKNKILIKGYFAALVLFLLAITITGRVFLIQTKEKEKYQAFAKEVAIRRNVVAPKRGNLYAADGALLATTISKFDLYMDLSKKVIKPELFNNQIGPLCDSLAKLFKKPRSYFYAKLSQERLKDNQYVLLAKNLEYPTFKRIQKFPILEKGRIRGGLIVNRSQVRVHPIEDIGTRTIGFDDARGKAGLEGAYSKYLKGKLGHRLEQRVDSRSWKPINDWNEEDPVDGYDVETTIDTKLQATAYQSLKKTLESSLADHGTAVVMEVKTGAIRALVNLERNKDGSYSDKRNWAIYERTEPGSTFKLISVLAALEDNKIDTATRIDTGRGVWALHNIRIRDDGQNYGTLSIYKAFLKSSNIVMAKMLYGAYRERPNDFISKLKEWKLNEKLDLDIPGESKPIIPSPKDKNWSKLSLTSMAYGYALSLTPLQILTFYNAIANKGVMVKPLFLTSLRKKDSIIKRFKPIVINKQIASAKNISKVQKMLEGVVEKGTAKSINLADYPLAGKTGTTQLDYWTAHKKHQASFCGYFPANAPKYSCIVVVNKPKNGYYGSGIAAPVFKEIAMKVYATTPRMLTEIEQNDDWFENISKEKEIRPQNANTMPDLENISGYKAIAQLENLGLKVKFKGIGKVKQQSIAAKTRILKGQTVFLDLTLL